MNEPELEIAEQIRSVRPYAKFVRVSHSRDHMDASLPLRGGFYSANLYDEQIDANLVESTRFGPILIQNTYLTSFAYNIFLCWLAVKRGVEGLPGLDALLVHNFKKFLAEQLYRQVNRIPSRALLLETLLYEQVNMVPVFAAQEKDAVLSEDSRTASQLMSLILSMHEFGHFDLKGNMGQWSNILMGEPEIVGKLYIEVMRSCPKTVTEEFQCDTYAVLGCLHGYKDYRHPTFAFRTVVFSFCAYSAMYSALKTAEQTAALWQRRPDQVNLRSIAKLPHVDHEVSSGIDLGFQQRTRWVIRLCEQFAARAGLQLFGDDGPFPLPKTICDDLMGYVGRVFDSSDDNARKMSNLVAQALTNSEEGMEYLYLRSKTFWSNRDEPLELDSKGWNDAGE